MKPLLATALVTLLCLFPARVPAQNPGAQWRDLDARAAALMEQGDLDNALKTAREALAITEQHAAGKHPAHARSLHRIGEILHRQGLHEESARNLHMAITVYRGIPNFTGDEPVQAARLLITSLVRLNRNEAARQVAGVYQLEEYYARESEGAASPPEPAKPAGPAAPSTPIAPPGADDAPDGTGPAEEMADEPVYLQRPSTVEKDFAFDRMGFTILEGECDLLNAASLAARLARMSKLPAVPTTVGQGMRVLDVYKSEGVSGQLNVHRLWAAIQITLAENMLSGTPSGDVMALDIASLRTPGELARRAGELLKDLDSRMQEDESSFGRQKALALMKDLSLIARPGTLIAPFTRFPRRSRFRSPDEIPGGTGQERQRAEKAVANAPVTCYDADVLFDHYNKTGISGELDMNALRDRYEFTLIKLQFDIMETQSDTLRGRILRTPLVELNTPREVQQEAATLKGSILEAVKELPLEDPRRVRLIQTLVDVERFIAKIEAREKIGIRPPRGEDNPPKKK